MSTETATPHKIQPISFDHVAVWVRNLDASIHWYGRVLGLEVVRRSERHAFLGVGDEVLALFQADMDAPFGGPHHIAIRVPDVETALDAVREQGIVPTQRGPSLGFQDLDEHWIHFSGPKG